MCLQVSYLRVKGSRFITHMKRLKGVEKPLANFFASGLFELRDKLGPVLWQLPPTFAYDPERLDAILHAAAAHGPSRRFRSLGGVMHVSKAGLVSRSTEIAGFATPSRSATKASATLRSSLCCGGIASRARGRRHRREMAVLRGCNRRLRLSAPSWR
jgi:hypothetical protein